jgi:hypothetical protein
VTSFLCNLSAEPQRLGVFVEHQKLPWWIHTTNNNGPRFLNNSSRARTRNANVIFASIMTTCRPFSPEFTQLHRTQSPSYVCASPLFNGAPQLCIFQSCSQEQAFAAMGGRCAEKRWFPMPNTGTTRPGSPLCGRTRMSDLVKNVDKGVHCFVSRRLGTARPEGRLFRTPCPCQARG